MNMALALITLVIGFIVFIAQRSRHFVAEFLNSFLPVSVVINWFLAVLASILIFYQIPPSFHQLILLDLSLLFLCLNLLPLLDFGAFRKRHTTSRQANLRVVSFNKLITNNNVITIAKKINQLKPDIVGLLEVKARDRNDFAKYAKLQHLHLTKCRYGLGKAEFLVLSRTKLENVTVHAVGNYGASLYAETKVRNQTLAILVVHTTAPIIPVLLDERNKGMAKLAGFINKLEAQNLIVLGDFNLTPWSPIYRQFSKQTKNKIYNIARGRGLYFTWKAFWPFIAHIDHIFASFNLKTKKFVVGDNLGSDHKLIYADLKI